MPPAGYKHAGTALAGGAHASRRQRPANKRASRKGRHNAPGRPHPATPQPARQHAESQPDAQAAGNGPPKQAITAGETGRMRLPNGPSGKAGRQPRAQGTRRVNKHYRPGQAPKPRQASSRQRPAPPPQTPTGITTAPRNSSIKAKTQQESCQQNNQQPKILLSLWLNLIDRLNKYQR